MASLRPTSTVDPERVHCLDGIENCITIADLDALCRDAERLAEIEDP
jgi:hypothetical protein